MGYSVRIYPPNGRSGFLSYGGLAPAHSQGTYYSHPSAARKAAMAWVQRFAGRRAEVVLYRTHEVVEEYASTAQPKRQVLSLQDAYEATERLSQHTDIASDPLNV